MTTKLTLKVDKSIVENAKKHTRGTGRSLSEIIENYLNRITEQEPSGELSPKLKLIVGVVKLPMDFDEKEVLRSEEERHL